MHLIKQEYGAWALPAIKTLRHLKFLRGTALDVFGKTEERKMERALIEDYQRNITTIGVAAVSQQSCAGGAIRASSGAHPRLRTRQGKAYGQSESAVGGVDSEVCVSAAECWK